VFAVTNALLILIAAGMAARGANFLVQAGWLPELGGRLWDTSGFITDESLAGQILATLTGYVARPGGMQVLAYAATVAVILLLLALQKRMASTQAVVMASLLAFSFLYPGDAAADSVKSPYVDQGEVELEQKGFITRDRDAARDNKHEFEFAVSYGVTSFWKTEVEAEFKKEPAESLQHKVVKWENTFQLTERGEYWLDPAAYAAIGWGFNGEADSFTGGLIAAKDVGPTSHTANLFLKTESGINAAQGVNVRYSWQSLYRLRSWLKPGFELYGQTRGKEAFEDQRLSAGPVLAGQIPGIPVGYEVGYQFGATPATPDGAVRWKLEYEFFF
jgi:hypothetical protein